MKQKKNDDFSLVKSSEDDNVYILSKNLQDRWFNYLWQSAAAGLITFAVLYVFLEIIQLIILAGVGSTFFTIFALPGNRTASNRNIIGSYLICVTVGLFCIYTVSQSLGGGLAVGLSALFMVITDTEHPPAAGVALGLSLAPDIESAYPGAGFSLVGALVAVILRSTLAPYLKNLI
ncbi:MAG: HPP family protein [Bacillota bacterium]